MSFSALKFQTPALLLLALLLAASAQAGREMAPTAGAPSPDGADTALPLMAAVEAPEKIVAPVASATEAPLTTPSQNVTINLIRRLVKKGLLTAEEAADLIEQAEQDAAQARSQASAMQSALAQVQTAAAAQMAPDPALAAAGDDAMRVTYIPESVKAEMREQIKDEVIETAKRDRWASPKLVPDWAMRIRLFGDLRVRGQADIFPSGNDNTGSFPNFNAINTGAPFDPSGTLLAPQQNVDRNRERLRLRARIGLEADLGQGFTAGFRIATGENNMPTSTNQSLGLANQGQGGNFSRYAIWLDRAFLKYELGGGDPNNNLTALLGRFDNPFLSSTAIWDENVGFDGVALLGKYQVARNLTPFLTIGAFPVFNTDFNFATNNASKFKSTDKWLYGGQAGTDLKITKDLNLKVGGAYYYFDDVQGKLSDPFVPLTASDQGNTDDTRPSFAQKGNTYFPIRQIIPTAANNFGTTNQFQYYGLVNKFHELAITGRLDYTRWEPYKLTLLGEYFKNLAFDRAASGALAVNNRGPTTSSSPLGNFVGGDTGWIIDLKFGSATLDKPGNWVLGANYRRIESDAVVDAFTDSDFGGGGTNLQGFSLYGAVALSPRVSLGLRWLSSREVAGPPLRQDIIQLDVNARF